MMAADPDTLVPLTLAGWAPEDARPSERAFPVRSVAMVAACLVCTFALAQPGGEANGIAMMLAIGLAACVSSIAGFAFSAIAGAMLFHLSADTVRVVQIMIVCSICNQLTMCWSLRRSIAWCALPHYVGSGAAGILAGVWLLTHVDAATYKLALGVFLLAFGTFMLLRKPIVIRRQYLALDAVVAFMSGICGGASGFPSAFVAPWCGMKGWDKARQRGLVQPFILIMQVIALATIGLASHASHGPGFDAGALLFIPASLLGTWTGLALYRHMSDAQFAGAVNVALVVSGLAYVV